MTTYEPVQHFLDALSEAGVTEQEFVMLNGMSLGATQEWKRKRSMQAPRWAVVQARLLAELRKYQGKPYAEIPETPASVYITMGAKATIVDGLPCWKLTDGTLFFEERDVPTALKQDPNWSKLTPGQKLAYMTFAGDPGEPIDFYNNYCQVGMAADMVSPTIPTR